jgi:hypothetical protein
MKFAARVAIPFGVIALLISTAFVDHYFRDELYYLACSHRLAWGYVDHPPLCVAILWIVRHVAGDSLLALRVSAALALAGVLWLTASIARRLGADAYGELLTVVAVAIVPEMLAVASFYSMNVFDVLLWTAAVRVLIDVIETPTDRRWLLLGLMLGLGLLNKVSVLWLGAAVAVGLVVTPARRLLLTRGPWMAAAVAGLLFLPHILWQVSHGWPTLEFIKNASRDKMQVNTPLSFMADQIKDLHPFALPIWGGGLIVLLTSRRFRPYRILGVIFLTVAAILIVNRTSRSSYLLPAYPMLFAAGGVWWAERVRGVLARVSVIALLVCAGVAAVPLAVPVLPIDSYVRYSRALGMVPETEEKQALGRLPQFFADRQGWEVFVAAVARAWDRLTPEQRQVAVVFTGNYGEAGAIEHLGRAHGLSAISGHNNYWLWGPGDRTGEVMLMLTRSRARLEQRCAQVEQLGETECGDCMPYENHVPIFVCRGLKPSLSELWPQLKHYE